MDGSGLGVAPVLFVQAGGETASITWTGTTFAFGGGGGIRLESGAHLTASELILANNKNKGLELEGASVEIDGMSVRDTSCGGEDDDWGAGIYATAGSTIDLRNVEVVRSGCQGIHSVDSTLLLEHIHVVDTHPDEALDGDGDRKEPPVQVGDQSPLQVERERGIGIAIINGTIQGSHITIERSRSAGLAISGGEGALDNVEVRDTKPRARDNALGSGLALDGGADLQGSNYLLVGNHRTGIVVTDATGSLDRVTITDTLPEASTGKFGRGIEVVGSPPAEPGATGGFSDVSFSNLYIADCYDLGLLVDSAQVTLNNATIERTLPRLQNGLWGRGIEVLRRGHLIGDHLRIYDNLTDGIALHEATADLTDVVVSGTREEEKTGETGRGIGIRMDSSMVISNLEIRDNLVNGLLVDQGSSLELSGAIVETTHAVEATGASGTGISISGGSTALIEDVVFRNNEGRGLLVLGSAATLVDVTIEDTIPVGFDGSLGWGLVITEASTVTAERVHLARNHTWSLAVLYSSLNGSDFTIEETLPSGNAGAKGWGAVFEHSQVAMNGLVVSDSQGVGVVVTGGEVTLESTEIDGVTADPGLTYDGVGVICDGSGILLAHDLTIQATTGPGLFVDSLATATCQSCTIANSGFASVVAHGTVVLSGGSFSETMPHLEQGGGVGVLSKGGQLSLSESEFSGHEMAAVWLEGPGSYEVTECLLQAVPGGAEWSKGNGLVALAGVSSWSGDGGLRLAGNTIKSAGSAGVLLDASEATLDGNSWSDNEIDLLQQGCDGVAPVELTSEPNLDVQLCPSERHNVPPFSGLWAN
jgi:hypothetical protein